MTKAKKTTSRASSHLAQRRSQEFARPFMELQTNRPSCAAGFWQTLHSLLDHENNVSVDHGCQKLAFNTSRTTNPHLFSLLLFAHDIFVPPSSRPSNPSPPHASEHKSVCAAYKEPKKKIKVKENNKGERTKPSGEPTRAGLGVLGRGGGASE